MMTNEPFAWNDFVYSLLFAIIFIGQAWVNIVNKKVSGFSIDALLLFALKNFGTKKSRKSASSFPRSKTEIFVLGICALLAGLKALQDVIEQLLSIAR